MHEFCLHTYFRFFWGVFLGFWGVFLGVQLLGYMAIRSLIPFSDFQMLTSFVQTQLDRRSFVPFWTERAGRQRLGGGPWGVTQSKGPLSPPSPVLWSPPDLPDSLERREQIREARFKPSLARPPTASEPQSPRP